jgi:hypothetical protein
MTYELLLTLFALLVLCCEVDSRVFEFVDMLYFSVQINFTQQTTNNSTLGVITEKIKTICHLLQQQIKIPLKDVKNKKIDRPPREGNRLPNAKYHVC